MPSRRRLPSTASRTYSGRPLTRASPAPSRSRWMPNLVATTTSSRRPAIARPTSRSLVCGPYTSAVSRKVTPEIESPADASRSTPARPRSPPLNGRRRTRTYPCSPTPAPRPSAQPCLVRWCVWKSSCPLPSAFECARSQATPAFLFRTSSCTSTDRSTDATCGDADAATRPAHPDAPTAPTRPAPPPPPSPSTPTRRPAAPDGAHRPPRHRVTRARAASKDRSPGSWESPASRSATNRCARASATAAAVASRRRECRDPRSRHPCGRRPGINRDIRSTRDQGRQTLSDLVVGVRGRGHDR